MTRVELWGLMLAMGAVTLALRASFLLLQERLPLPAWAERYQRLVPAAVLAALVAPALLAGGEVAPHADPRFWAGLVAALAAWRTRSVPLTLGVGMATLWALRALT